MLLASPQELQLRLDKWQSKGILPPAMIFGHLITHLLGRAVGQTKAGQLMVVIGSLIFIVIVPIGMTVMFSGFAWAEFSRESHYQQRYGGAWKAEYEADHGRLSTARVRMGMAIFGGVINPVVAIWLWRLILPALTGEMALKTSSGRRRRKRRRSPP